MKKSLLILTTLLSVNFIYSHGPDEVIIHRKEAASKRLLDAAENKEDRLNSVKIYVFDNRGYTPFREHGMVDGLTEYDMATANVRSGNFFYIPGSERCCKVGPLTKHTPISQEKLERLAKLIGTLPDEPAEVEEENPAIVVGTSDRRAIKLFLEREPGRYGY